MKLAYKVGKDNALKIALIYAVSLNLIVIPLAGPGNIIVLWLFTITYGVAYGAAPTLLRSMIADLTDEDELKTGEKRSGLFFALYTTTGILGGALGVGLSFGILDLVFNFQPGTVNSAAALDGLLYTYTLGFALPMFVAYIAMIKYPLTKQKHEEIVEKLRKIERR